MFELQLWLDENPPSSGAINAAVKRIVQIGAQGGRNVRMTRRWPRRYEQLAIDQLGDEVVGDLHQVLIRRRCQRQFRHSRNDTSAVMTVRTAIPARIIPIAADARTSLVQWRKARTRETATESARRNAMMRIVREGEASISTPASANAPTVWPLGKDVAEARAWWKGPSQSSGRVRPAVYLTIWTETPAAAPASAIATP